MDSLIIFSAITLFIVTGFAFAIAFGAWHYRVWAWRRALIRKNQHRELFLIPFVGELVAGLIHYSFRECVGTHGRPLFLVYVILILISGQSLVTDSMTQGAVLTMKAGLLAGGFAVWFEFYLSFQCLSIWGSLPRDRAFWLFVTVIFCLFWVPFPWIIFVFLHGSYSTISLGSLLLIRLGLLAAQLQFLRDYRRHRGKYWSWKLRPIEDGRGGHEE